MPSSLDKYNIELSDDGMHISYTFIVKDEETDMSDLLQEITNSELHLKDLKIVDSTGCGDAFRAALIYGICDELSWEEMGRLGSLMGSKKVAKHGTQNHSFTLEELLHQL